MNIVTSATNDADFYRFSSIVTNDKITTPTTRKIGKYTVVGQNHKNGALFETEGLKHFVPIAFEKVTEEEISIRITAYHDKQKALSCHGTTDKIKEQFYYDCLQDQITIPRTRQIGKYTAKGQDHKGGALFTADGIKYFVPDVAFDKVTESHITCLATQRDEKLSKEKADYDTRFEAGRKIIEEIGQQESEHVTLVATALKQNPAIISAVFKKHPEILKEILPSILREILPNILHTELQDLRKELMSSLHTKLPEIIRAMVQDM